MNISSRLLDNGNYSPKSESNYYNALIETQYLENNNKMAQIRGTIQQVPKPREFVKGTNTTLYYSIKVNDVYYSVGSKKPPEQGTLVEFEANQKPNGYWDVVKDTLRVVQAQAPQSGVSSGAVEAASNSVMSKDDYWRRKEERDVSKDATIQLQSCRNSAIEFVKLLLAPVITDEGKNLGPSLKLPAALAKREAVLFEAVKKYTQEFVSENSNSSEKNNKNEQLPQDQTESTDSSAADSSNSAWDV